MKYFWRERSELAASPDLPSRDSARHRPSVPGDGRRGNGPLGQRAVLMCTLEGSAERRRIRRLCNSTEEEVFLGLQL